ncbi:DUF4013 domain-containing protein [Marinobacter sp. BGYM27]|uniref:DUF4013 domain-containing protein n=1 Tax=Marinobacter sp. BGYM27 TaxID=2975597 RepID=UPI0021A621A9|nr:DUF4013 domain-containing protein [Marinobacter sp. BGYM27]
MKHDCHYHPNTAAKWHCGGCQLHYCTACMPDADTRRKQGLCPHCGQQMRYLGAATEVVPFWNRIPEFFRYPFRADSLLVIAICTFVPMLVDPNVFGLIISVILLLALFKYTYAIVTHTAEGHMTPPPLSMAFSGAGAGVVVQQLLVFILMGGLIYSAGLVGGPVLAMLAVAFLVLALPASMMILAMEQSVGPAVNPLHLASLISRIGWPYFVLYGHLILMMLVSGAIQDFAFSQFPAIVAQPLSGFVSSSFLLIFFHMMGYLLFQYQEELGFASDLQDQEAPPEPNRALRVDADLDMSLKDGQYDKALTLVKAALKRDPSNPMRLEQLYRLLWAMNDGTELYRNHPRLLLWLADRRDAVELGKMLQLLEQQEPGFRLDDPALTVSCARLMYREGEHRTVLRLLQDFHKRFPDNEHIAPAYLLVAQSLTQGMAQWEKATAFLNFIKKRCPDHPLSEQMDGFLQQAANHEPLQGPPETTRAQFSLDPASGA